MRTSSGKGDLVKSYLETNEEYFGDFIRVSGLAGFEDLMVLVTCDGEDASNVTHAESLVSVIERACIAQDDR